MQDFPVFEPEKYSAFNSRVIQGGNPKHSQSTSKYGSQSQMRSTASQFRPMPFSNHPPPPIPPTRKETLHQSPIKAQSRIEYVPIQKKVIDYVDEPRYHLVPKKKTITDFVDKIKVDVVPREVVTTDYYAVENLRFYIPQTVLEKEMEYVPKQTKNTKFEYIPVERTIVHYPQHSHKDEASRYLGVAETKSKKYDNLREADLQYWEKQFGYKRGQPIEALNRKIKDKYEEEKGTFFQKIEKANEELRKSHMKDKTVSKEVFYPSC